MANNAKIKKYFPTQYSGHSQESRSKDAAEMLTIKSFKTSEASKVLPPSTVKPDKRLSKGVKDMFERFLQRPILKLM